ncbi:hypothetical protein BV898_15570 [Hypsibius exemplaris]|uniref:Uncharacterized protein n=1 Tax=Hypsibius exemplaris TaxID=2072580 RepID=A0A9X6NE89_HYPEX|nr:hypothetical protein BV898_15570 [Hypsibius exemplaris]
MLDPWGDQVSVTHSDCQSMEWANFATPTTDEQKVRQKSFDDNFAGKKFEKLPDSSDYLSVLEKKLSKVQGKRPSSSSSKSANQQRRDLLTGLSALRSDRMKTFLDSTTTEPSPLDDDHAHSLDGIIPPEVSSDFSGNDAVSSSWLMQRIHPERQALSEEELAALVRHDFLARMSHNADADQLSELSSASLPAPGCEDAGIQSSSPRDEDPVQRDPTPVGWDGNELNRGMDKEDKEDAGSI